MFQGTRLLDKSVNQISKLFYHFEQEEHEALLEHLQGLSVMVLWTAEITQV